MGKIFNLTTLTLLFSASAFAGEFYEKSVEADLEVGDQISWYNQTSIKTVQKDGQWGENWITVNAQNTLACKIFVDNKLAGESVSLNPWIKTMAPEIQRKLKIKTITRVEPKEKSSELITYEIDDSNNVIKKILCEEISRNEINHGYISRNLNSEGLTKIFGDRVMVKSESTKKPLSVDGESVKDKAAKYKNHI